MWEGCTSAPCVRLIMGSFSILYRLYNIPSKVHKQMERSRGPWVQLGILYVARSNLGDIPR
jgi:hypothetical protein